MVLINKIKTITEEPVEETIEDEQKPLQFTNKTSYRSNRSAGSPPRITLYESKEEEPSPPPSPFRISEFPPISCITKVDENSENHRWEGSRIWHLSWFELNGWRSRVCGFRWLRTRFLY